MRNVEFWLNPGAMDCIHPGIAWYDSVGGVHYFRMSEDDFEEWLIEFGLYVRETDAIVNNEGGFAWGRVVR